MGLRSPSRCAYRYGTACATAGDEPTVSPESKTLAPDCVAVAAAKVKAGTATVVGAVTPAMAVVADAGSLAGAALAGAARRPAGLHRSVVAQVVVMISNP